MNYISTDERIRKTLLPVRVLKTTGNIAGSQNLLRSFDPQIGLSEQDCAVLVNGSSGEPASVLLDFGKEIHGSPRIFTFTIQGARPAAVHIVCGESAAEALSCTENSTATNDHAVRDTDYLLPCYSDMTLNETGFRFVYLRLDSPDTKLSLKRLCAVSILRDLPYLGSFQCNDALLNRIYDTAAYTCHLCLQGYVWDGIKRDRLVWIGDMHPEMLTVRTVFGNLPIIRNSLELMARSTPLPGWMNGFPTYSLWWMIIVRDWYFYTGDKTFLEENTQYISKLALQIAEAVCEDGSDTLERYFLDWPSSRTPGAKAGSRALLRMALQAGEELTELLSLPDTAALCRQRAACIGAEDSAGFKQAAAMLSLAGLYDSKRAAEEILKDGAEHFSTFMSYYLLTAAAQYDLPGALNALRTYYGGMLQMGATTFWEDFDLKWMENAAPIDELVPEGKTDIHSANGGYCYVGFRHSLCHGWSSAPTAFLAETVLGIEILAPGCKKMRIAPRLGDLTWARGTYPTPLGLLTVSCTRNADGTCHTEYSAPDGMEIITR